mgnify:CR=1 FL=1
MSPPAEPRRISKKMTGAAFVATPVFSLPWQSAFCTGWETRFYQPAVSFVTIGFPSASSSGVNPPAYPLTIKR